MAKMERLVKLEGVGNVQMLEADIPTPGPKEVLIKVNRSLISRGSELFRRYVMREALLPRMMGYSDAGEVVEVGTEVRGVKPGDRSNVDGPHAQYVTGEPGYIPEGMDYETATFIGLSTSSTMWMRTTPIEPGDDVVVLGQGIVGNLYMQAVRERQPGRVISVDATELRCDISRQCGTDVAINASETDSVEAVMELTDGRGADVVVECVGGNAGIKSFEQAQLMLKVDGVLHLIDKYQGAKKPGDGLLPLDLRHIHEQAAGGRYKGARAAVQAPRGRRGDARGWPHQGRSDGHPSHALAGDRRGVSHAVQQTRRGAGGDT